MVRFEKARPDDAKALARVSWRAFDYDTHYGAPSVGGPPGYRSDRWQSKMMQVGEYFKITCDGEIIGGFIVFDRGYGNFELARIFIDPELQNQGIGTMAVQFIERTFPQARTWALGTPRWNRRNHHFYEKLGYVRSDEDPEGFLYEKEMLELVEA